MTYIAIEIGCLECGIESGVLRGFDTREEAEAWAAEKELQPIGSRYWDDEPDPQVNRTALFSDYGGQVRTEIHEVPS